MKIKTLIVDDESLARDRVKRFLRDDPDIQIIGECSDGKEAIAAIKREKPDLVFLDIQMPEKNGFEVIKGAHVRDYANGYFCNCLRSIRPAGV